MKSKRTHAASKTSVLVRSLEQIHSGAQVLRSHRLNRTTTHVIEQLRASAQHPSAGRFEARVADLSAFGAALIVANDTHAGLILAGDRIENLILHSSTKQLFHGAAVVRRVDNHEQGWLLGVEVEQSGIDLDPLYRWDRELGFARRFAKLQEQEESVSAEFRLWTTEVADFLRRNHEFLDAEEQALDSVDRISRDEDLTSDLSQAAPIFLAKMRELFSRLGELAAGSSEAQHAIHRAHFRRNVLPALTRSAILARFNDKPLGHAADYETLNMLFREGLPSPSLFGKLLDLWIQGEPIFRAQDETSEVCANLLLAEIERCAPRRASIAYLCCGSAQELVDFSTKYPDKLSSLDVTLLDRERSAGQFCERTIGKVVNRHGGRARFMPISLPELASSDQLAGKLGNFDLIMSSTALNSLPERSSTSLVSQFYSALSDRGTLWLACARHGHPQRWLLEYVCDWFINYYSDAWLRDLGNTCLPQPLCVQVETNAIQASLYLRVQKQ